MSGGLIEKTFSWDLRSPPRTLWPILSDTQRLNEALKMPLYRITETIDSDGRRVRYGEMEEGGTRIRWEEPPYDWVEGNWWRWRRFHETGPMSETSGTLVLSPLDSGGTRVSYMLCVEPNGTLGKLLVKSGYLKSAAKAMEALCTKVDAHCQKPVGDFFSNLAAEKAPNATAKPIPCVTQREADRDLLRQLSAWLAVAPLADVQELRSRRLARALGTGESEALRACLLGVAGGALHRRHRAICPSCRASGHDFESLAAIPPLMACRRCGAGYRRDLTGNIESFFAVAPDYRRDPGGTHCASGPGTKPHTILQQTVTPLERRDLSITAASGRYILRVPDGPATEPFELDGPIMLSAILDDGQMTLNANQDGLVLENTGRFPVTVALERAEWDSDALPAVDFIADQAYLDLGGDDGLAEGDSADCGFGAMLAVMLPDGVENADLRGFGAVCSLEGDAALMICHNALSARQVADALIEAYPEAAIGIDYGPLTFATAGGVSGYIGTVPETALRLCDTASFGDVLQSGRMKAELSRG